jgi:hypothetical protein
LAVRKVNPVEIRSCRQFIAVVVQSHKGPGLIVVVIDLEDNISPPVEDGDLVVGTNVLQCEVVILSIPVWGNGIIDTQCPITDLNSKFL